MIVRKLRLFGASREFSDQQWIEVESSEEDTVAEFKRRMIERVLALRSDLNRKSVEELTRVSALGTDSEILFDGDQLRGKRDISLLPPVSGG